MWDEETWGIIILWVALCIYVAAGAKFENIMYGLVFNYALFWIWYKRASSETRIKTNIVIISLIHGAYIIGFGAYSLINKKGYFFSKKSGAGNAERGLQQNVF